MESPAVETAATNAVGCMASDNSCFSPGARNTAPTRIDDTTASSSFTALSSAVAAEPAPAPPAPPMDAITEAAADSTPSVRCMLKSPTSLWHACERVAGVGAVLRSACHP